MKRLLLLLLPLLGCSDVLGPVDERLEAEIFGVRQMYCAAELPSHHHPFWCTQWAFSDTFVADYEWWPYTQTTINPDGTFQHDTLWWTALQVAGRTSFASRRQWALVGDGGVTVLHEESLDPAENQGMIPLSGWLFEEQTPLLVELEARWGNGIVADSLWLERD